MGSSFSILLFTTFYWYSQAINLAVQNEEKEENEAWKQWDISGKHVIRNHIIRDLTVKTNKKFKNVNLNVNVIKDEYIVGVYNCLLNIHLDLNGQNEPQQEEVIEKHYDTIQNYLLSELSIFNAKLLTQKKGSREIRLLIYFAGGVGFASSIYNFMEDQKDSDNIDNENNIIQSINRRKALIRHRNKRAKRRAFLATLEISVAACAFAYWFSGFGIPHDYYEHGYNPVNNEQEKKRITKKKKPESIWELLPLETQLRGGIALTVGYGVWAHRGELREQLFPDSLPGYIAENSPEDEEKQQTQNKNKNNNNTLQLEVLGE